VAVKGLVLGSPGHLDPSGDVSGTMSLLLALLIVVAVDVSTFLSGW
jgi:translation elongation factor EF-G